MQVLCGPIILAVSAVRIRESESARTSDFGFLLCNACFGLLCLFRNVKESQSFTDLDLGDDGEKVVESARTRSELGNRKRNPAAKRHLVTKKHYFAASQVGSRKRPVAEKPGTKLAILNKVS